VELRNLDRDHLAQTLTLQPPRFPSSSALLIAAALLAAVALIMRWTLLGDPLVHLDEEFYLLVGNRMAHGGALPYVDIWDRKPIGLFLIYAGASLLGGDGVLQYQLVACLFAWGTALTLFLMGRRLGGTVAGIAAGAIYLIWLDLALGGGGQSPVFYNLPVAIAIARIFFARDTAAARSGDLRWAGAQAMLLFGIAMQIKYTAVFEGMFAGVMLLFTSWQAGRRPVLLLIDALLWVTLAVAPTALAAAYYASVGHLSEWMFANIYSIVGRNTHTGDEAIGRLSAIAKPLVPLLLPIPLRRLTGSQPTDPKARSDLRFIDIWAACAILGMLAFGTYYNHYALPLYAPLAVAAAPLGRTRSGRVLLAIMIVLGGFMGLRAVERLKRFSGDETTLAHFVDASRGARGCIFVLEEMPILYLKTNSCLPTTHPFPGHLRSVYEAGATGIDQEAEVARIMARRPDRIVTQEPASTDENWAVRREVYAVVRREYVELYRFKRKKNYLVLYGRKGSVMPTLAPPATTR
jgi:4-amino-4-deoxy-L-arabinose transferase-like glycosyltransferase